jgi:hypothetical protein
MEILIRSKLNFPECFNVGNRKTQFAYNSVPVQALERDKQEWTSFEIRISDLLCSQLKKTRTTRKHVYVFY